MSGLSETVQQQDIWLFYTLSNGGVFMAPEVDSDATWRLFNYLNGNDAEMSAEASGITVCLIAYSHHASRTESEAMTTHGSTLNPAPFCALLIKDTHDGTVT